MLYIGPNRASRPVAMILLSKINRARHSAAISAGANGPRALTRSRTIRIAQSPRPPARLYASSPPTKTKLQTRFSDSPRDGCLSRARQLPYPQLEPRDKRPAAPTDHPRASRPEGRRDLLSAGRYCVFGAIRAKYATPRDRFYEYPNPRYPSRKRMSRSNARCRRAAMPAGRFIRKKKQLELGHT